MMAQGVWLRAFWRALREAFGALKLPRQVPMSAGDAADLRAFKAQAIHQALLIKNEADDRARKVIGVDGASGAHRDDHDRAIDPHFPAIGTLELAKGLFGHEHDDDGPRLHPEL